MISPDDLISLAERLAAADREVEGRSAVSRAYYGAFHEAKRLIEHECGVVLPPGGEAHRKLQLCLDRSDASLLDEIARRLQSLRDDRNRADYQLADSRFADPVNVQTQLKVAKEVMAMSKEAGVRSTDFRDDVREYASRVLKLRLRNIR
jgi:hypothetical protein